RAGTVGHCSFGGRGRGERSGDPCLRAWAWEGRERRSGAERVLVSRCVWGTNEVGLRGVRWVWHALKGACRMRFGARVTDVFRGTNAGGDSRISDGKRVSCAHLMWRKT